MTSPASPHLTVQGSLLEIGTPRVDQSFATLVRHDLDEHSWVDLAPGWLSGAQTVFDELIDRVPWEQNDRWMYDKMVTEPRLHGSWSFGAGDPPTAILPVIAETLTRRYRALFDSVGINLYRDGRDSVAWHRDRIAKAVSDPLVAIVSVGEERAFRMRPYGGGLSREFRVGHGDLLVTGGRAQREWEHSVPKVRRAGARISITLRHTKRLD